MRKPILTYGSLLTMCVTMLIVLEVKNLWGKSLSVKFDLFENHPKFNSGGDITDCIAGTWLGTKSSDWNDPSNWCKGYVPFSTLDVRINAGGNQPIINATANCQSITINEGATLTITNTNLLNVYGDWVNNGVFNANTSTVTFKGKIQNISGNNVSTNAFYNLILSGSTVEFNVPIQASNNLTINNGTRCTLLTGFSSTNTLTLGDYGQVDGEWGSSYSDAIFKNNIFFNSTTNGKLIVTINSAIPGLWLGKNAEWETASNWSDGVIPTRETDAIITSNLITPEISKAASCKNLLILPNSKLEIKESNILSVSHDWNNQGTFTPGSGTVIFDGANQSITKGAYYNLTLGGSGTKTISEVSVSGILSMEGTASVNAAPIYGASAILQYNTSTDKTVGPEWPASTATLSSIIIMNKQIFLDCPKIYSKSLTVKQGATLDLGGKTIGSPSAINLECGGISAGSIIKGTGQLTLGGNVTITNSGQGIAAAVIECPIVVGTNTFNIEDGNLNATDPTDLLINKIKSGTLTKTGTGTMSINGDCILNILTIDKGNVTIQPKASLKISGNITSSVGATGLYLLSDVTGTGSLLITGTAKGSATLMRSMTAEAYHLVSSPLAGQSINSFLTSNTTIQSGKDANADYRNMRDYNPVVNNWNDFFKVGASATTGDIIPGKGYSIRVKKNTAHQVVFTGTLPNGDISLSGLTPGSWNCIGNPYTSAIMINSPGAASTRFLENNTNNLDPAFVSVYVWDPSTNPNQYTTISNATDPYDLQQGQAFMVKMATDRVNFNRAMQINDVSLTLKSTEDIWPTINLMAMADSTNSSTTIAFHEGMTPGLDPSYDAGLLSAGGPIDLYTRLVDDYGIPFAIQALPSDQYDQLIIPVGVDYSKGGPVSFSAQGMYLPSSCRPILEDKQAGILTDLTDKTYTADLTASTAGTGRFYLHTSYASTGIVNRNKNIFKTLFINNRQLKIQGKPIINATITLTDVLGRQIISRTIKEEDGNIINIPPIKSGTYVLNIHGRDITQTLKAVYVY